MIPSSEYCDSTYERVRVLTVAMPSAGLGRRSLLPSIPETILDLSTSAGNPERRKAVEASIMPQVPPCLLNFYLGFLGGTLLMLLCAG